MQHKLIRCIAFTLLASGWLAHAAAVEIALDVQKAHEDIWKRFISPYDIILDYNTLDGKVIIPSPEECQEAKPNALSWWTPIENGAFFNGLYLDAMVRRWKLTGDLQDRVKSRRLADGLLRCSTVSNTPGFVARGVSVDGKSHYSLGSDDQTGPWFYGLWRYIRSGAPSAEEKQLIENKMTEVAAAIRANGWLLPADPIGAMQSGQIRGSFRSPDYRAATRYLFVSRIMMEITGEDSWRESYEKGLHETFSSTGKSRLDHLTEGIPSFFTRHPEKAKNALWLFLNSQGILLELAKLESRPEIREKYLATMKLNAKTVALTISEAYPPGLDDLSFKTDWRTLNTQWRPQTTQQEASKLAAEQLREWKNSGKTFEINVVREPFCAAAIVFMTPNQDELTVEAMQRFKKLLSKTPWDKLYSSYGIFAELAWYAWMENRKADTAAVVD